MTRRRSTIGGVRRELYRDAALLGDAEALSHGPSAYLRRRARARSTRLAHTLLRRTWRLLGL